MLKLIIFDFDGTLIDSKKANLAVARALLKHFKQKHDEKDMMLWHKLTTKECIRHFFPWYKRSRALRFLEGHRKDFFHLMKLNKNVVDVLKYIKKNKYWITMATNRGKSTYPLLKQFKLEKYFDFVSTASMVRKHKPYPHQINYIRRKMKVRRDEILYVGDSFTDSIAAKRAKVKCVIYKNNRLRADYHISDIKVLKHILASLY